MLRSEMFDNTRAHGIPLVLIFPSASGAQERGAFHWGPVEHQGQACIFKKSANKTKTRTNVINRPTQMV